MQINYIVVVVVVVVVVVYALRASCLKGFTGLAFESSSPDVAFSIPNISTQELKRLDMNLIMLFNNRFLAELVLTGLSAK